MSPKPIDLLIEVRKIQGSSLRGYLREIGIEPSYKQISHLVAKLRCGVRILIVSGTPEYEFLKSIEKDAKLDLSKNGVSFAKIERVPA